jgi:hypothetical protein
MYSVLGCFHTTQGQNNKDTSLQHCTALDLHLAAPALAFRICCPFAKMVRFLLVVQEAEEWEQEPSVLVAGLAFCAPPPCPVLLGLIEQQVVALVPLLQMELRFWDTPPRLKEFVQFPSC